MIIGSIVGVGAAVALAVVVTAVALTLFYRRNANKQGVVNKEIDSIAKKL
jgi:uncharacterized membrane protein (DUF485 family)